MTFLDPRKYVRRPWLFRKKVILVFAGLTVLFFILGCVSSWQLYNETLERHYSINWERVLRPLWQAPFCAAGLYACLVGFWLIFRLKQFQHDQVNDWLQNGVLTQRGQEEEKEKK